MGSVTVWMQMSFDGFAEGPNGEFDWPIVGPELNNYFIDELGAVDTFLYGRRVYEMMAAFWPTADANPEGAPLQAAFARIWKPMPKLVFSRTLDRADWNTTVVSDRLAEEVMQLKQQPDSRHVLFGGANTVATFMRLDLIDEYRLFVHPVLLGEGRSLLSGSEERKRLALVEARTFDGSVVGLHYKRTDTQQ